VIGYEAGSSWKAQTPPGKKKRTCRKLILKGPRLLGNREKREGTKQLSRQLVMKHGFVRRRKVVTRKRWARCQSPPECAGTDRPMCCIPPMSMSFDSFWFLGYKCSVDGGERYQFRAPVSLPARILFFSERAVGFDVLVEIPRRSFDGILGDHILADSAALQLSVC
jgi:hypothetical protein